MKFIWDCVRYDTEKSTLVTSIQLMPERSYGLYRTPKDRWFLCHPDSRDFLVLDNSEAVKKLEEYGKYDIIESYFGNLLTDA